MMESLLNDLLMGYHQGKRPAKPGFMVIGTQNPITMAGRRAPSTALSRRLTTLVVDPYPLEELNAILIARGLKEGEAKTLAEAFVKQLKRAMREQLSPEPTLRDLLKLADSILKASKALQERINSTVGIRDIPVTTNPGDEARPAPVPVTRTEDEIPALPPVTTNPGDEALAAPPPVTRTEVQAADVRPEACRSAMAESLFKDIELKIDQLIKRYKKYPADNKVTRAAETLREKLQEAKQNYLNNKIGPDELQTKCKAAVLEARPIFAAHRGWHKLNNTLRQFLGILAALTIIPALAVAFSTKGYSQTFFKTPKTDAETKLDDFEKKLGNDPTTSPEVKK